MIINFQHNIKVFIEKILTQTMTYDNSQQQERLFSSFPQASTGASKNVFAVISRMVGSFELAIYFWLLVSG